jgi:SAM-dependent methyltransferase
MATTSRDLRNRAFGEEWRPTAVDNLGVWLSARRIRRSVAGFAGRDVADVGCGYHATFARSIAAEVRSLTLFDIALSPEVRALPGVHTREGRLPEILEGCPDEALDVVVCNSVLEHLWEPGAVLAHFHRMLRPDGVALLNVPSWRGKFFLELSAFRLRLSPPDEMDDHKTYYDRRDLWPLLVRAGFLPHNIRCFSHKMGMNTFAICRREAGA